MFRQIGKSALVFMTTVMAPAALGADGPPRPQDPMWQNSVCVNPVLPRIVVKKRLTGHTSALFDITAEGEVENIRITDSDPKGVMDGATKRALRRWSYFLHFEDGYATPRKDVPITFTFGEEGETTCRHIPLPEQPSTAGDPSDPYIQLKQCTMLVMQQKEARDGISGKVTLGYDISKKGKVENIEILSSTPEGVFDNNAERALARWKYHQFEDTGEAIARSGLKVDFYYGDLPEGAPNNRCGHAPWEATNIISDMEYYQERQKKPFIKKGAPAPSHGKN